MALGHEVKPRPGFYLQSVKVVGFQGSLRLGHVVKLQCIDNGTAVAEVGPFETTGPKRHALVVKEVHHGLSVGLRLDQGPVVRHHSQHFDPPVAVADMKQGWNHELFGQFWHLGLHASGQPCSFKVNIAIVVGGFKDKGLLVLALYRLHDLFRPG